MGEKRDKNINGVVIGIVTNNQDPEHIGRIKIKFPWREDSDESYWARVSTLMAGKNRGTFFLPEVDDEVVVAFDHGDIHHPYVLGSLWSSQDTPPETNSDGKNSIRKIRSRSGHEIVFSDEDGNESLEIHTKGGHHVMFNDLTGVIEIKDKSGNESIILNSNQGSVSISSQMKISLEAQMVEIKAGSMLTLQGGLVKIN